MKSFNTLLFLFVLFHFTSFSQQTITSGRISIDIDDSNNALHISSIKDNGTEILNTATNTDLFTLYIHNTNTGTDETITASSGWGNVTLNNNGHSATIALSQPTNANLPSGLSATLTIDTNNDQSAWDLSVSGLGSNCSLMDVIFPQLNIKAPGNDKFLYPLYSGRITENPGTNIDYFNDANDPNDDYIGIYPRGWGTTMQFFSYYNSNYGIYFGFHDPDAGVKEFGVKNENGGIKIQCKTPAANRTLTNNDWEFPGNFELDLFNGNWYDAALIYKNWVSAAADYFPVDSPDRNIRQHKAGDIGVWLTSSDFSSFSMTDMENNIQTAINFFDVPVGMTFYQWNYNEYDHFYPQYFPERTGLDTLISNLQSKNDFTVMPYINGRLWDTGVGGNDAGDANAATYFNNSGLISATKKIDGNPFTHPFAGNIFAIMCPTQTDWQNILIDAADQITKPNRLGAGSVYLDMVAASGPTQCMDANHSHTLGGGSFWRQGYKQMFENIHNTIPSDDFVAVEGGCDFIADQVDAFMVQGWQTDHQVPAWQAVYAGKIQLFGMKTGTSQYPLQKFYGRLAQAFAYGVQTGRQSMWLALNPSANPNKLMAANFVRDLSRMRYKLRNFMSYGEMKRPILPQAIPSGTSIPTITYDVYDWGGHHGLTSVTNPAIQTSTWQNNNEVVVVFVNGRIQSPAGQQGDNIDFKFSFNGSDYGLTGDVQVQELTPASDSNPVTKANSFEKNVSLGNLEMIAYKITGNTQNINENQLANIVLYPNPAKKIITIKTEFPDFQIQVFNMAGQELWHHKTKNNKSFQMSVSQLTSGIYIVKIKVLSGHFKNQIISKRLIVK